LTKQVSTITIGGTAEAGDVYTLTVNGKNVSYTVQSGNNTAAIVNGLIAAVNGTGGSGVSSDADVTAAVTAASASGTELTLTGNTDGTAFTLAVSAADPANQKRVDPNWYLTNDGTSSGAYVAPQIGDIFRLAINGNQVDYTVVAGDIAGSPSDTHKNIADKMMAAINADPVVSNIVTAATPGGLYHDSDQFIFWVTADNPYVDFTITGALNGDASKFSTPNIYSNVAVSVNDQTISSVLTTAAATVVVEPPKPVFSVVQGTDGTPDSLRADANLDRVTVTLGEDGFVFTASGGEIGTSDDVNIITFNDMTLQRDTSQPAETTFLLYQALLGRMADFGGLTGWKNAANDGMSFEDIAIRFMQTEEFAQTGISHMGESSFVATLYENAFGRTADEAGLGFWTEALKAGAYTRGEVAVLFAQSAEMEAIYGSRLEDGVFTIV